MRVQSKTLVREDNLSAERFARTYLRAHRPVVISGAASHWPAVRLWSYAYLAKLAGDHELVVRSAADYDGGLSRRENEESRKLRFADVLRFMTQKVPPPLSYARETQLLNEVPALSRDISEPPYLPACSPRRLRYLPRDPGPPSPSAWIGPRGTMAQLHWDPEHNLYVQIRGRKRFLLISPDDADATYPNLYSVESLCRDPVFRSDHRKLAAKLRAIRSDFGGEDTSPERFRSFLARRLDQDDVSDLFAFLLNVNLAHTNVENPDPYLHPRFRSAEVWRTTLLPGDILFIPFLWRHFVRALTPSISVNWFFPPRSRERHVYRRSVKTLLSHLMP